jgi:hypothetical protein
MLAAFNFTYKLQLLPLCPRGGDSSVVVKSSIEHRILCHALSDGVEILSAASGPLALSHKGISVAFLSIFQHILHTTLGLI